MKRVSLFVLALLISVAFVTTGFAQDKAKAPEKPAAAAEKPAAAAPEKPATPEKAAAPEQAAKPKAKPRAGFVGEVTAIDAAAKIFTVKSAKEAVTFDLTNAKFKGYKDAGEIKTGDKVVVKYAKAGIKVDKIGGKKATKAEKAKKAAFKDVDKNSDGKITVEELVIVFVNVTPDQFKALDKNNDGALDESEYKAMKPADK